jgi:hypothetical protein
MVEAIDSVDRVEATPVYNEIYEAFNCTRNRKHRGHHYERGYVSPANLPERIGCMVGDRPVKS